MKKIVIAGGDKRMSCLAELLFNSGYSFASYAVNGGLTKDEFLRYLRENNNILLILPLPVSRDKIHLNTGKAFEDVRLSEIGECLESSATVALFCRQTAQKYMITMMRNLLRTMPV